MANYYNGNEICRSAFIHKKDHEVIHYFGCLNNSERGAYFNGLKEKEKDRLKAESARFARLRRYLDDQEPGTTAKMLIRDLEACIDTWRDLHCKPRNPQLNDPNLKLSHEVLREEVEHLKRAPENDPDLKANVIYYKGGERYDHPQFLPAVFPNQKIPIERLLNERSKYENPLMMDCDKDMIRYFHLPANNMHWVEVAIARYYNEVELGLNYPGRRFKKDSVSSKTEKLLHPQLWRNLQHSGHKGMSTYSRHMLPRCHIVSTGRENLGSENVKETKNFVISMPFLHWETDRRREKSAEWMRKITKKQLSSMIDVVETARKRVAREDITLPKQSIKTSVGDRDGERLFRSLKRKGTVMKKKQLEDASKNHVAQKRKCLGQLLLCAARVAEAMDYLTDERLMEKYIEADPPLHPRRTLDQFYNWTLKDTRNRDRDQVVYRGTAPRPEMMHNKCIKIGCENCQEILKKQPRVVMVDQLWMFILDENTIITAFQRRWGRNKPDQSAVQKCIQRRLREARNDEVQSVFDLALIIVDQCCQVFFDRFQPTNLEPLVLNEFANAIGIVASKQSRAFTYFWLSIGITTNAYRSKNDEETTEMKKRLLDISLEGKLFLEIKDILDELNSIVSLKQQQKSVVKDFIEHIRLDQGWEDNSFESQVRMHADGFRTHLRKIEQDGYSRSVSTQRHAADLLKGLMNHGAELNLLIESAMRTSEALKDFLALKQQQVSIVEAREAVKQSQKSQETLMQGRAIMMFTIVTIIFLPLSFFTSIFGMNTTELNGGLWTFRQELTLMLPISVAVIAAALFIAFNMTFRTLISLLANISWTWFMTQTPLYEWWHNTAINKKISELESTLVADMKKSALSRLSRNERRRRKVAALMRVQAAELIEELMTISRERQKKERTMRGDAELKERHRVPRQSLLGVNIDCPV